MRRSLQWGQLVIGKTLLSRVRERTEREAFQVRVEFKSNGQTHVGVPSPFAAALLPLPQAGGESPLQSSFTDHSGS